MRFERLATENGLSHDSVFSILQDRHGYLWFGTQGGLNRYDGYRFTQFRHDPLNPNSIAGDFVQILFEDSRGGIWAGRSVLSRFDPATETFTRYALPDDGTPRAGRAIPFGIAEDDEGFIWLGLSHGPYLYRLDPETGRYTPFEVRMETRGVRYGGLNAMYRDAARTLWLGTVDGLIRFDPKTGGSKRYPHGYPLPGRRSDRIRGIAPDALGKLWLATVEGAPNLFDPIAEVFSHNWAAPDTRRLGLDSNNAVAVGRDGAVWVGTLAGLQVFEPISGAHDIFRNEPADQHSLSANEIWAIFQDRDGDVWIGTKGGGVNRFSPASLRFGAWLAEQSGGR